jgi:hypothetical protein
LMIVNLDGNRFDFDDAEQVHVGVVVVVVHVVRKDEGGGGNWCI